ncbi:hypothetical protein K6M90_19105 [Rhizobium sp. 9T]|uniref:Uncharacterized protein n=1 Tax=Rhizobium croatiense TaxID=2867516 RepID=A0ABS7M8P5_9HYPH|nr:MULTISPECIES: hypothetical protein [Rhizobium]MBY4609753.1 hypothetical protein [Rhizobium croatiense]MBY4633383.1 hypothetical protein [Rhizobium croatiense]WET72563.1 hypothetical protein PYR68_13845 [Rhizobium croatiense]
MSFIESNMAGGLADRAVTDRPWHGPEGLLNDREGRRGTSSRVEDPIQGDRQ